MLPNLRPGDEVVASDHSVPYPGSIVVFEHPAGSNRWLIKRLVDEDGTVVGDNPGDSHADSRTLGPIDLSRALRVVERLSEDTFRHGVELLADEDARLANAVDSYGVPDFWSREPGFETLVLLILEQQVSLESGAAMYRRLAELLPAVSPEAILAAGDTAIRGIGMTRQKTQYLLGLADAVISGSLSLTDLEEAPVLSARHELMALKGIGPWTADAYLLSASRRPDMWPVGDRALQVGAGEVLGMKAIPNEDELEILGEPWRPLRAVAARIIWHAYLTARGRVEPPDPTKTTPVQPSA